MAKRIAIVRFWYEGNRFSSVPATRDDFRRREWLAGDEAARFYAGKGLEPGGAIEFLRRHPEIEGHFVFCAAAYPAGPIEAGLFGEIVERVLDGLRGQRWDGVYLSLHGAAVCADVEEAELKLLRAVRASVGSVPVAASFDLHANMHPQIAGLADIVLGYKTYPHVDMAETGAKALALLCRAMRGEIDPASVVVPAGFAPTSFNMRTAGGPMGEIAAIAAATAAGNALFDVTPFGGFVYADSAHAGASVTVCAARGSQLTAPAAERIAAAMRRRAAQFDVRLPAASTVLEELRHDATAGPVAVIEPADNPFSGGAGDTPDLLRAVLDIMPDRPSVFAFFWDPDLVATARRAGLGAPLRCAFGGRLTGQFGAPVQAAGVVERLTDGRFRNVGPMERDLPVDLGETAVIRVGAVRVIVTSRIGPVNDPGYFRLHGVDLAETAIVFAKAKNHFRAAFAPLFERIVEVETRGPAPSDLSTLPFQRLPAARLRPTTGND